MNLLAAAALLVAQQDTAKQYVLPMIFRDSTPIEITLTAPFKRLKRERFGDAPYHKATISYAGDSGVVQVPLRVKARGIWRREHCDMPPLWLNFSKDSTKKTLFRHLDRVRLVMHCRDGDDYEQYVLQELQLYRVQRFVTPLTLDTRLVHVTYVDSATSDTVARRYAFIMEDDAGFAARVGGRALRQQGATPEDIEPRESAVFGVFEYLIGNTDFSIAALHNVILLLRDTAYYAVAHDYDFSGAVNTRYATPPAQLKIPAVTTRVMRGYCAPPAAYERAFELFKAKKDSIYASYHDAQAALLKPQVVERTLKFFDDFYALLENPRAAKRQIIESCLNHGA